MYYTNLVNIQHRIDGFLSQKENPLKKLVVLIVAQDEQDEAFRKSLINRSQYLEGIEVNFYIANENNKGNVFKQITNEPIDESTGYIIYSIANVCSNDLLDFARKLKNCKLLILRECILNDHEFELKISLAYTIYEETLYWQRFDKSLEMLRKEYMRYSKQK